MKTPWWSKLLRIVAIVLMSLTAAFTLMGGAGTSCVALNPAGFGGKFAGIAPYQWLWILFVVVGIIAGILGVRAVVRLVKGQPGGYRAALIALLLGTVINAIHLYASRSLRGSSMPVDGVLYMNLLTLVVFLILRIPKIRQGIQLERPSSQKPDGGGIAAIALAAVGLLTLTIQFLMAPTHTIEGFNYADAWHVSLTMIGSGLILAALLKAIKIRLPGAEPQTAQETTQ